MLQTVQKQTGVTPPALLSRPKANSYDTFLLQEFNTLSGSRDYGEFGPKAIKITEMESYLNICDDYETPAAKLRFIRLMQRLDQAFRAHEVKKLKAHREAQRNKR